jgi:hypothetical protein
MTELNRTAILAAADWLEANPDKHISGDLAQDADGNVVSPLDPEADCFCAMGRLIVESGGPLNLNTMQVFGQIGRAVGIEDDVLTTIWMTNDSMSLEKLRHGRRGNPAVIPLLRELAA